MMNGLKAAFTTCTKTAFLYLVVAVSAQAPLLATERDDHVSAPPCFKLSAVKEAVPQLIRQDQPRTQTYPIVSKPPATPFGPTQKAIPQARETVLSGSQSRQYPGADRAIGSQARSRSWASDCDKERGTSYLVNWSPWISHLATRWFTNLKLAEQACGLSFETARPALIQFTCYADGHIGDLVLKQSSGIPLYDRMQAIALLEAAPLPAFPAGTERRTMTLVQGWESRRRSPTTRDFEPTAFAAKFPQESIDRWGARDGMQY